MKVPIAEQKAMALKSRESMCMAKFSLDRRVDRIKGGGRLMRGRLPSHGGMPTFDNGRGLYAIGRTSGSGVCLKGDADFGAATAPTDANASALAAVAPIATDPQARVE
jgi:hypothetical protein